MPTYDPRMDMQTLDKNLWETSGARFNAAERLARQSALSLYAAAALSLAALSLAATMLGAATMLRPCAALTLLAAMLSSALALAFSLIEASAAHGVKSERLHANALALRSLMRAAPAMEPAAALAAYRETLAACPDNHLPMDWQLVHARRTAPGWRTELAYAAMAYGWRLALAGAGLAGAVTPLWWVAMAG